MTLLSVDRDLLNTVSPSRALRALPVTALTVDLTIIIGVGTVAALGRERLGIFDNSATVVDTLGLAAPFMLLGWVLAIAVLGGYRRNVFGAGDRGVQAGRQRQPRGGQPRRGRLLPRPASRCRAASSSSPSSSACRPWSSGAVLRSAPPQRPQARGAASARAHRGHPGPRGRGGHRAEARALAGLPRRWGAHPRPGPQRGRPAPGSRCSATPTRPTSHLAKHAGIDVIFFAGGSLGSGTQMRRAGLGPRAPGRPGRGGPQRHRHLRRADPGASRRRAAADAHRPPDRDGRLPLGRSELFDVVGVALAAAGLRTAAPGDPAC